jgi:hypothetical protein
MILLLSRGTQLSQHTGPKYANCARHINGTDAYQVSSKAMQVET